MEGAKGGCLAVLMADAGWHGKVTGLSVESRITSQVLRGVPESMLRRMRPDSVTCFSVKCIPVTMYCQRFMNLNVHGIGGVASVAGVMLYMLRWDLAQR